MLLIDKLKNHSVYSHKAVRLFWVFVIQHKGFVDVFQAIAKKQRNGLQKQLGSAPNDELGILTCHGRILNADIPEDAKYSKMLPQREHFTGLVIKETHEQLIHA